MISAFLYVRVSSRKKEQEGFSIPVQLKLLRDYAIRNGLTIKEEFVGGDCEDHDPRPVSFTECNLFNYIENLRERSTAERSAPAIDLQRTDCKLLIVQWLDALQCQRIPLPWTAHL